MQLVVDASIALRWCFGGGKARDLDIARSVLKRLQQGDRMVVPAIWLLEIGNVLLRAEKDGQSSANRRERFFRLLEELDIRIDENGVQRGFSHTLPLAEQQGLTPYDASYLELALREGLSLASLDAALRRAAVSVGVSVFASNDEIHETR